VRPRKTDPAFLVGRNRSHPRGLYRLQVKLRSSERVQHHPRSDLCWCIGGIIGSSFGSRHLAGTLNAGEAGHQRESFAKKQTCSRARYSHISTLQVTIPHAQQRRIGVLITEYTKFAQRCADLRTVARTRSVRQIRNQQHRPGRGVVERASGSSPSFSLQPPFFRLRGHSALPALCTVPQTVPMAETFAQPPRRRRVPVWLRRALLWCAMPN
jgi:hypothetical protein